MGLAQPRQGFLFPFFQAQPELAVAAAQDFPAQDLLCRGLEAIEAGEALGLAAAFQELLVARQEDAARERHHQGRQDDGRQKLDQGDARRSLHGAASKRPASRRVTTRPWRLRAVPSKRVSRPLRTTRISRRKAIGSLSSSL